MVRKYLEWHSHEVRTELSHSPYNGQSFQLGGGIGFLSLVEGPRSAADDALLAIADLSQDCAEACGRLVGVQPKSLAEVGEGSDGAGSEERLEAVWQSALQWKTASLLVRACRGPAMAAKFFRYRR